MVVVLFIHSLPSPLCPVSLQLTRAYGIISLFLSVEVVVVVVVVLMVAVGFR